MAFTEDHPRLVAVEWFVEQLLVIECNRHSDPQVLLRLLKESADAFYQAMMTTREADNTDQITTIIRIKGALDEIFEAASPRVRNAG